jgi:hypothetical protein
VPTNDADRRRYRSRFPCHACETGYLDCAALAALNAKCCSSCAHPERFAAAVPYSADELDDMAKQ